MHKHFDIKSRRCALCAFAAFGLDGGNNLAVECRVHPPRLRKVGWERRAAFPTVPPDSWCGRFRALPPGQDGGLAATLALAEERRRALAEFKKLQEAAS